MPRNIGGLPYTYVILIWIIDIAEVELKCHFSATTAPFDLIIDSFL